MIYEEICTYEVCKLAKEKGFPQDPDKNDHCLMYCWDGLRNIHPLAMWIVWEMEEYDHDNLYAAPTQTLLQRWLREEKGYYVYPFFDNDELKWTFVVREKTGDRWIPLVGETPNFDVFEEAMEAGLKFTLKKLV